MGGGFQGTCTRTRPPLAGSQSPSPIGFGPLQRQLAPATDAHRSLATIGSISRGRVTEDPLCGVGPGHSLPPLSAQIANAFPTEATDARLSAFATAATSSPLFGLTMTAPTSEP